jgi:hypothetical protein
MADNMPIDEPKTLKAHNSQIVNPTTPWSYSLKSYNPYLLLQKVFKYPHAFAVHCNMPKSQKAIFWPLKALRDEES